MDCFDVATIFVVAVNLSTLVGDMESSGASPATVAPPKMIGNPIKVDDYPQQAMRNHQEGSVSVELKISADGAPLSCEVTESAGYSALDEVTCRRLMKAHFEPARDPNGVAVGGNFHTVVGWSMPSSGVVPDRRVFLPVAALPSGYVQPTSTFLSFDAAGSLATCEIKASSGSKAFDATACAVLRKQIKIAAPHAVGNVQAAGYRYVPVAASPAAKP